MESSEVSLHEAKVWRALKSSKGWMSNADIGRKTTDVAPRTVRAHVKKLAGLGLIDTLEVFPRHMYRVAGKHEKRNSAYTNRLNMAEKVLLG